MKNRKIWGLALILVIGLAVTMFTDRILKSGLDAQPMTKERWTSAAMAAPDQEPPRPYGEVTEAEIAGASKTPAAETASAQNQRERAGGTGEEEILKDAGQRAVPAPAALLEEGPSEPEDSLQTDGAEESSLGPEARKKLDMAEESPAETTVMAVVEVPAWRNRLDEVKKRIQKAQESLETSATSNSLKSQAAAELNLWESELNSLYSQILEQLDEDQAKKLAQQQREWMKQRDSNAMAAAKNSLGGAESVEYIASLAKSTEERAYALLALYEEELDL